jgi:uncharacterized protein with PIN domain
MLMDSMTAWDSCTYCNSENLIFGVRSFVNDKLMKVECECKDCGKIFWKNLSKENFDKLKEREEKTK